MSDESESETNNLTVNYQSRYNAAFSEDTRVDVENASRRSSESNHSQVSARWGGLKKKLAVITTTNHGVRKVDFVLAYQKSKNETKQQRSKTRKLQFFLRELRKEGLKTEYANLAYMKLTDEDDGAMDRKFVQFVLIQGNFEFFSKYAEILNINMPLRSDLVSVINDIKKLKLDKYDIKADEEIIPEDEQILGNLFEEEDDDEEIEIEDDYVRESCFKGLSEFFKPTDYKITDEKDYFTATFKNDKSDFFNIETKKNPDGIPRDQFFLDVDRIRMIAYALGQTQYGKKKDGTASGYGIKRLLNQGVVVAAYPVHDGSWNEKENLESEAEGKTSMRELLTTEWASFKNLLYVQPFDAIKNYLGEQIGLYFAFMGFYVYYLVLMTILGLIVFLYGIIFTMSGKDPYINEIKNDDRLLCPKCNGNCDYFPLSLTASVFTGWFDNFASFLYACLVPIISIIFLELWKRRTFDLQYDWDLSGIERDHHPIRPEYEAKAQDFGNKKIINVATGEQESYISPWKIIPRRVASFSIVLIFITMSICRALGIVYYRNIVGDQITAWWDLDIGVGEYKVTSGMITSLTASAIDTIAIVILDFLFESCAEWITELEIPRTQEDFGNSYATKLFSFKCINYYSSMIIIAFFKNTLAGYPGNYSYIGKGTTRYLGCEGEGCSSELTVQLAFVMLGAPFTRWGIRISTNAFYSCFLAKRRDDKIFDDNDSKTLWEEDFKLLNPTDGTKEYLDLSIQFGFVVLFSSAFSLAPLIALLTNFFQIRVDAQSYTKLRKRPTPVRVTSIGRWDDIFRAIALVSVITNSLQLSITSPEIEKMYYWYENGDITGYIDSRYSLFNTSDFLPYELPNPSTFPDSVDVTQCYYLGYREPAPSYTETPSYWETRTVKLLFIIVFNYGIFLLVGLFIYVIPDRDWELEQKIKIEQYLLNEVMNSNIVESDVKEAIQELAEEAQEEAQAEDNPEPIQTEDSDSGSDQEDGGRYDECEF